MAPRNGPSCTNAAVTSSGAERHGRAQAALERGEHAPGLAHQPAAHRDAGRIDRDREVGHVDRELIKGLVDQRPRGPSADAKTASALIGVPRRWPPRSPMPRPPTASSSGAGRPSVAISSCGPRRL